jgi:hypothetical protein
MSDERIIELLTRVEQNQRKVLEAQQQHLQIAQAQLDRSNKTIEESIQLQRTAVARQVQVIRFALPLVVVLIGLIVYLMLKWRVL